MGPTGLRSPRGRIPRDRVRGDVDRQGTKERIGLNHEIKENGNVGIEPRVHEPSFVANRSPRCDFIPSPKIWLSMQAPTPIHSSIHSLHLSAGAPRRFMLCAVR